MNLFIFFTGCKFCSVLRGFFFADGEILIIPCGLIFAVIQTLLFYSFYSEIVLRKTSTKILREFAFADGSIDKFWGEEFWQITQIPRNPQILIQAKAKLNLAKVDPCDN